MSDDVGPGVGVVVFGVDAEAVADRVGALRAEGRRAAGFVGGPDDRAHAEAMAAELFGPDAVVIPVPVEDLRAPARKSSTGTG